MSQKQKDINPEDNDFSLGYKIPDIGQIQATLDKAIKEKDALQKEHQEINGKEEQGKVKKPQRRGGSVCVCEDPGCRIGPMMERN